MPIDGGDLPKPSQDSIRPPTIHDQRQAAKRLELERKHGPRPHEAVKLNSNPDTLTPDEQRGVRNKKLANDIIGLCLDAEYAKTFQEGKLDGYMPVTFTTPKPESDIFTINFTKEKENSGREINPATSEPVIDITPPMWNYPDRRYSTSYGDLPWDFVDSTGDEFNMFMYYRISPRGRAYTVPYIFRSRMANEIHGPSDDVPRFNDVTIDVGGERLDDGRAVGGRNFEEQDYQEVEELIALAKSGKYTKTVEGPYNSWTDVVDSYNNRE